MGEKRLKEIQFCPVCGSVYIRWLSGLTILDPHKECNECGHRGVFIIGNLELVKKVREKYLETANAS